MASQSPSEPYPGERATAAELFQLAEEYRRAASLLMDMHRRGQPLSRAPFHLTALHAIELYLNAFLLSRGLTPCDVRKLHHDLSARIGHEHAGRLALRKRTAAHLEGLSKRREYLISRYGTDQMRTVSQINRMRATLDELQSKVAKELGETSTDGSRLKFNSPGRTSPAA
jgi:hypothetical protein